jgi:alkanesulfonate monooxygenase SsuD/methylene tetrahydromethanopterin reductase-like flavin-dependent oxidoreductase (luciferase family)
VRLFVAETPGGDWSELTEGAAPPVRVEASDLAQARRARARIRLAAEGVAVILDLTVAVADDFRSAQRDLVSVNGVRYVGTIDGLAGLIADIESAGVADGVTLIGGAASQDLRALGRDVLERLATRGQPKAS